MEKVIIFGIGQYCKRKYQEIRKHYEVMFFIDNRIDENSKDVSFEGIEVYNPLRITTLHSEKILIMSKSFIEMVNQLLTLGVPENMIMIGQNITPPYDAHEELFQRVGARFSLEEGSICITYRGMTERITSIDDLKRINRKIYHHLFDDFNNIKKLSRNPISRTWGIDFGTPIDRYYIESFISNNREYICGNVMEIADSYYTKKYGINYQSRVLHINGWGQGAIKGNLATGEGLEEESIDCLICTQTIQMIYDIFNVPQIIYKSLRSGGAALITAHGISQISLYDYNNWGEYWRFTSKALSGMFSSVFGENNIKVETYGNAKVATAMLYGLSKEDLSENDLNYKDDQYQVLISVLAHKV